MKTNHDHVWRIVGLMSGTSMDHIDAVLVELKQVKSTLEIRLLGFHSEPYPKEVKGRLAHLVMNAGHGTELKEVCDLNFAVGKAFAHATTTLLKKHSDLKIDLIASHGQTVWHQPRPAGNKSTLQLGTPVFLVKQTGITTVHDFRPRDVSAGGQGAPLVSLLDLLLFRHGSEPRVMLNIGGIANVTYVPPLSDKKKQAIAFDTGPGNALIDDSIDLWTKGGYRMDDRGQVAARGSVDEKLVDDISTTKVMDYLKLKPPKTTGKDEFGWVLANSIYNLYRADPNHRSKADYLATVTAFTAKSIADAIKNYLPADFKEIIASGGGTKNTMLMSMLRDHLQHSKITTTDDHFLPSQAKEGLAFAVMAYHSIHHWPGNVPACTGAAESVVLGSITPGNNYRDVLKKVLRFEGEAPEKAVIVSE